MASDGVVFYGKGATVKVPPKELPPIIPVIFVPGVMGSNLRVATGAIPEVKKVFEEEGRADDFTLESWRPPTLDHSPKVKRAHLWKEIRGRDSDAVKLAKRWEGYGPKIRQALLSPAMTEVDPEGPIQEEMGRLFSAPDRDGREEALRRGWGSVHWQSYGRLLRHLEMSLNRGNAHSGLQRMSRAYIFQGELVLGQIHLPEVVVPTSPEIEHAASFLYPVFAFGYNFTRSNADSAEELLVAIERWIGEYQKAGHDCKQVILVTHSLGGLVARAASKKDKKGLILGVIHGVMPAVGAPVLYRRVVAGWETEDGPVFFPELRGLLVPLGGRTSAETTPVVGNAQGILEMLPSHLYPNGWLKVEQCLGAMGIHKYFDLPEKGNPYDEIYKQKDVWWRLIDPDLLDPAHFNSKTKAGIDPARAWKAYLDRVSDVQSFHHQYASHTDYHDADRTYVFYGSRRKTFNCVSWWVQNASKQLTWSDIRSCSGGPGDHKTYRNIVKVLRRGIHLPDPAGPVAGPYSNFIPGPVPSAAEGSTGGGSNTVIEPAHIQVKDGDGDETVPVESGSAPGKRISNICKLRGFEHQYAFDDHIARAFTILTICKLAQHSDCKARTS